uniref:Uncharacterized protein n=1 Tax=Rhizophora mucronata TaxID=61149 RepID=A0A2P2QQT2_RHIMU
MLHALFSSQEWLNCPISKLVGCAVAWVTLKYEKANFCH